MKKNLLLVGFIFALTLFFSCASSSGSSGGEVKTIRIAGNPTTGYTWELKSQSNDCVKLLKSDYKADSADSRKVGAGGEFYFDIQGIKEGESELVFNYVRPWDKNDVATVKSVIAVVDKDLKVSIIE